MDTKHQNTTMPPESVSTSNHARLLDEISSPKFGRSDPFRGSEITQGADRLQLVSNDSDIDDESDYQLTLERPSRPDPQYSSLPTGLCYDARMRFHTELNPPRQAIDYHPEDPRRILWIYRHLCEAGLVANDPLTVGPVVPQPLVRLSARPATKKELITVHSEDHFDFMRSTAESPDSELTRLEKMYDSVYFSPSTFSCALLSAGGAIDTCLAVARGDKVKNAIAIIRPPGHHAEACRPMGFCHFDNVSVAVNAVRETFPETIRRVMIVDWDVHHGNGIQQAFESDPNVLYRSIHGHENGMFYPSGNYGDHLHCGLGPGLGKNINIPWPTKGMGDSDYLFAFQHVVMPVGLDFNPDMVVIAAGFDAAHGDQLGGCFVTPACYAHMTHMLKSLACGRLVACLEGGYNLEAISRSALAVTRVLMGEPPPQIAQRAATKSCVETIKKVIGYQAKYWRCLYPRPGPDCDGLPHVERLHDLIRSNQAQYHFLEHGMEPVWIFRDKASKSFENQIIATPNWDTNEKPVLMIFHDPPEVTGQVDPLTGRIQPESTMVVSGTPLRQNNVILFADWREADLAKHYIDWAVQEGFAVVDINIPKFLTEVTDPQADEVDNAEDCQKLANELAMYLWENYIETNSVEQVVFLGIGEAYRAAMQILNSRVYERLQLWKASVCFVYHTPIYSVHEEFFSQMGKYYQKRSRIFVHETHPVWDPERGKKPSKKFGKLIKSTEDSLGRMMWQHREEVQNFLLSQIDLQKYPNRNIKEESPRKHLTDTNAAADTIMVASS